MKFKRGKTSYSKLHAGEGNEGLGRVILCTGKIAKAPYCIEKLGIHVWSVEELCYCFRENAFLLDQDIVSAKLAEWLEEECGLAELSGMLYPLVNQKGTLAAFVCRIMEYTGYYDTRTLTQISQTLQSGADLSDYEKKKKRGDFLMQNHKYAKALLEYEWPILDLPEQERELRADILHNMGVALAGLFQFEDASVRFLEAYQCRPREEYYRSYLAAKRMLYDDSEYISFVAEYPDAYDISLKLEREVDRILEDWENSEELGELNELLELKEEGQNALYYEEINTRVQRLKDRYREYTQI